MEKITFTFNPISISKKLLSSLEERPRDILIKRFGLNTEKPRTLESIGKEYGITRERVRQIEVFALSKVRQSEEFSGLNDIFGEIRNSIEKNMGVVEEKDFLASKAQKEQDKPHLFFLLAVGNDFERVKEDSNFYHCWSVDSDKMSAVRKSLLKLHACINEEMLLPGKEVFSLFESHLRNAMDGEIDSSVLPSLIKLSRIVRQNALGEWGCGSSPHVKPRGMRDYAFLVMRRHGSPMHFREAAFAINELFKKPAHPQTVHNELIKDNRFVLVGRGLYALKEWGYEGGVVRNVIEKVLSKHGPLSKNEIIKRVLKERYVKENTILVNLQNRNYFKKNEEGDYTLV